jgi:hypothetical protein
LIFIEQDPDDPTVFVVASAPDEHAIRVIPTLKALLWWTLGTFEHISAPPRREGIRPAQQSAERRFGEATRREDWTSAPRTR